jgi:hypothetical protein
MDYVRGYITAPAESRGIRPGRRFKPAHRINTAAMSVHAVEAGGPAISLCGNRVSRMGRNEARWDSTEPSACGLCADVAEGRVQTASGPASE